MILARVALAASLHIAGAGAELPPYNPAVPCWAIWEHPKPNYPVWVRFGPHFAQTSLYEAELDHLRYWPVCPV